MRHGADGSKTTIRPAMHELFVTPSSVEAFLSGEERVMHEKFPFVDNSGQRKNRAESLAQIKERSSWGMATTTLSEEAISTTGNTAVATYRMAVRPKQGGGADFRSLDRLGE